MPAKGASKVWKSYSLQRFKPMSKVPRHPKKLTRLDRKWTLKLQNVRKRRSQKNKQKPTAKMSSKGSKFCQMGLPSRGRNDPKIIKIHKFAKMDPRDVPGSKRHPKCTQKSPKRSPKRHPKRHPKGVKQPSKRHPNSSKENPTAIAILKSQCRELQRTLHTIRASQLKQNHKIGMMAGCAAHWICLYIYIYIYIIYLCKYIIQFIKLLNLSWLCYDLTMNFI